VKTPPVIDAVLVRRLVNAQFPQCRIFRAMLPFDSDTWARARAWTLWKALTVAARLAGTNTAGRAQSQRVVDAVLGNA